MSNTKTEINQSAETTSRKKFYLATWRWHFYAGIYVIPFILMLSVTGLIMVLRDPIESFRYGDRLFVTPGDPSTLFSAEAQASIVQEAYPEATFKKYIPATAPDRSTQISIVPPGSAKRETLTVFVNPYTGQILGDLNPATTWYSWANDVHGEFFIGETGDYLIEIASGLSIMLIITGVFLWWPRNKQTFFSVLLPRLNAGRRIFWRDTHATIGFWTAPILLFFLISGLAWTSVWGKQLTQAWSSFPAQKWKDVPLSDQTHASLNRGVFEEVAWALELTPLPESGSLAGLPGIPESYPVTLDTVMAYAKENGFSNFRVNFPKDETGVWTVSAETMSGDIIDPRQDRTIHIDQYTGNVLADVKFADYSLAGKAMAAGIALHMGKASLINWVANIVFCLLMILAAVSSIIMWWLRRPQKAYRLAAPPMPANFPLWKGAILVMLFVSLAFPLTGITLLIVLALDVFILSKIPALKNAFN